MLRNGQELTRCREELGIWFYMGREAARMVRDRRIQDADDLIDVINKHIEHLKAEIDNYRLPHYTSKENSPFDVLRQVAKLPEALVKARITLGLSQRQFARIAKMSAQQLSRYERTQFANLTLKSAARLINCLESESAGTAVAKIPSESNHVELEVGDLSPSTETTNR